MLQFFQQVASCRASTCVIGRSFIYPVYGKECVSICLQLLPLYSLTEHLVGEKILKAVRLVGEDAGGGRTQKSKKKDTVLRQLRLDPCDLQPIFDDMLHILNPEELHIIEEIPAAEDKLDQLFEIAGVKSQEASQTLLDSAYSHLLDLL
ncbi:Tumor necrosis factor receptor superfamily member 21 [Dissostichus eleginoides]|uniref:Tumor necrosis factor receptor superfamily member 21 n=1 Tax=Dissostichus eleginoides TaxID=100907 RepID=A0AAD9B5G3_DISEL|nr:Tumor necrosis factor receptor superfamily member 21 [Dissostichus eleginoides]